MRRAEKGGLRDAGIDMSVNKRGSVATSADLIHAVLQGLVTVFLSARTHRHDYRLYRSDIAIPILYIVW